MNGGDNSELAFPHSRLGSDCDGMTLRDYFAAKVLPSVYADYCASARQVGFDEGWVHGVALDAYRMADAMLKSREHKS